jgi:hypothetical protein
MKKKVNKMHMEWLRIWSMKKVNNKNFGGDGFKMVNQYFIKLIKPKMAN